MSIRISVGANDVAALRFSPNAVWEASASLHSIAQPNAHILHARIGRRLPATLSFDLDLLLELSSSTHWAPDLLGPVPSGSARDPIAQYEALRDLDPAVAASDLKWLRAKQPQSRVAGMSLDEYVERVVTALVGYHQSVLAPLWDRVVAIAEADIAHHRVIALEHGLSAALREIHDELRYVDGTIFLDIPHHDLQTSASGDGVWLVPTVFKWPWIAINFDSPQPVIAYGARGAGLLWETPRGDHPTLASLIGRSRAAILERLSIPQSTTRLATALDLTPATVSAHLSVMTSSGLLHSHRAGKHVLYARTPVADRLVEGVSALQRL